MVWHEWMTATAGRACAQIVNNLQICAGTHSDRIHIYFVDIPVDQQSLECCSAWNAMLSYGRLSGNVRTKFAALWAREFVVLVVMPFFCVYLRIAIILTIATGHRISVPYVRTVAPAIVSACRNVAVVVFSSLLCLRSLCVVSRVCMRFY